MSNVAKTVAQGLLRPINSYSPILIGFFTAIWGLWLVTPTWDTFSSAPLFEFMSGLAPEWAWGLWSFFAGCLVIYHTAHQNFVNMMRSLGFIMLHWFTVAWMLWLGDWQNTGGICYTGIAAYSTFLFLNVRINYAKCISPWDTTTSFRRR